MNRDKFEGGVRTLRGRGKTAFGAVTGRPRQQAEGAYDQAAGAVQQAYGDARETARNLQRDGVRFAEGASERRRAFADDVQERGHAIADDVRKRGRYYRSEAVRRGRVVATRADDNKTATLALVAVAAFGLGWKMRRSR